MPPKPPHNTFCFFCLSLILATAWLFAGSAQAQTYGKLFTHEDIYALSVEGFKLGISQDEASVILKRDHWEGHWHPFVDPDVDYPFSKGNSKLYLMRSYGKDKKLYIWGIVDKKVFERPHYDNVPMNRAMGDIWIDTVIDQFGEASMEFSNPNGVNAYVYYLIDRHKSTMPKLEIYLGGYETTYELTDRSRLNPEQRNRW